MSAFRAPFLYVSHPQVRVDPAIPVPRWGLSEVGRRRAEAFARSPLVQGYGHIVSSDEEKAKQTAAILGGALGLSVSVRADMHENDRSATGYLKEAEFQQVADAFFAAPLRSVRGWERAVDAQARIVRAVEEVMAQAHGAVIFVGHGGVGTLLLCALTGAPISRAHDQPPVGGGCWFHNTPGQAPDRWRAMEEEFAP